MTRIDQQPVALPFRRLGTATIASQIGRDAHARSRHIEQEQAASTMTTSLYWSSEVSIK